MKSGLKTGLHFAGGADVAGWYYSFLELDRRFWLKFYFAMEYYSFRSFVNSVRKMSN